MASPVATPAWPLAAASARGRAPQLELLAGRAPHFGELGPVVSRQLVKSEVRKQSEIINSGVEHVIVAVALLPDAFSPSAIHLVVEIFCGELLEIQLVDPIREVAIAFRIRRLARLDPFFSQVSHESRFEAEGPDCANLRAIAHTLAGEIDIDVAG